MEATTLSLSHQDLLRADRDPIRAAKAARLTYVTDSRPGISRVKKGKGFSYVLGGKAVKDSHILQRIRSLVIPPAWTRVWICADPDGHIQATGLDVRNRKQYRYHS